MTRCSYCDYFTLHTTLANWLSLETPSPSLLLLPHSFSLLPSSWLWRSWLLLILQLQRNKFCQKTEGAEMHILSQQSSLWWDHNPSQHLDCSLVSLNQRAHSKTVGPHDPQKMWEINMSCFKSVIICYTL